MENFNFCEVKSRTDVNFFLVGVRLLSLVFLYSGTNLTHLLNAPFLYPLKTSENHKVFWYFQWVEKESIGNEWVKRQNYFL